jgi:hypothetical protein
MNEAEPRVEPIDPILKATGCAEVNANSVRAAGRSKHNFLIECAFWSKQ